jgi:NarL family two-component system response regulator LiaR
MSTTSPIRVLIADDHHMVRRGLMVLMEEYEDLEVIGEANDGEHALQMAKQLKPDVVLMDMNMPRMDGVAATRAIREACPTAQIVILTSFNDEDAIQNVLKAGAISFLMKNISGDELANAIRRANASQSTLAPEAAQVLIKVTTSPPAIGHDLTDREIDVLVLMIEGLNNREIGERLVISSSTVKNHVSSILSKLGTVSRTQAVALAVENKLIDKH